MRPVVLACCIAIVAPMAAQAQQGPPSWVLRRPPSLPPGQVSPRMPSPQTLADAVRRAERMTGGQVLNAESLQFEGREVHRVKVLAADGRVMVVVDDPRNSAPRPPMPPPPARGEDPRPTVP